MLHNSEGVFLAKMGLLSGLSLYACWRHLKALWIPHFP